MARCVKNDRIVIALCGGAGAGKTTAAKAIMKGLQVLTDFNMALIPLAKPLKDMCPQGIKTKGEWRKDLIKLGNDLKKTYGGGYFAHECFSHFNKGNVEIIFVDDLRFESEFKYFNKHAEKFICIKINSDEKTRLNRMVDPESYIKYAASTPSENEYKSFPAIVIENNEGFEEFGKHLVSLTSSMALALYYFTGRDVNDLISI